MFLSEATPSGFFFLAPWLVFFPVIGLLTNIIFGDWFAKRPSGETPLQALHRARLSLSACCWLIRSQQAEVTV